MKEMFWGLKEKVCCNIQKKVVKRGDYMEEAREKKRYFKDLNRKDYIERAYEIIKNEGEAGVSIRRMAREFGCSTTCLYRYFENIDELIYYAYIIYLDEYLQVLHEKEKDWKDIWDMHIGIWEGYSRVAFTHPKAFDTIFFSPASRRLTNALREFYSMFPERINIVSPYLQVMLWSTNLFERDMVMAKRCVEAGVITMENARHMNRMICLLYKGYLKEILDYGIRPEDIEKGVQQFRRDVERIVDMLASDTLGHDYK